MVFFTWFCYSDLFKFLSVIGFQFHPVFSNVSCDHLDVARHCHVLFASFSPVFSVTLLIPEQQSFAGFSTASSAIWGRIERNPKCSGAS
jgi:hypothetical protein